MGDDRSTELHDSPAPALNTGTAYLASSPEPRGPGTATPRPPAIPVEWSGKLVAQRTRRIRLYLGTLFAVAAFVYVVALAVSNTRHVRVDWVFGSASLSLVWLLLAAIGLGGLLGLSISGLVRRRTRPRRSGRARGSR